MITLLVTLHVLVSFIMIGIILLQSGKGAEIGAAFGGSSQTIFGSRGPGTFLSKLTVAAAVLFMLTSLGLSILGTEQSVASKVAVPQKEETAAPPPSADMPPGEIPAESGAPSSATGTPETSPSPPAAPGPSADTPK
jgi:preprotein translocase subunit SecG